MNTHESISQGGTSDVVLANKDGEQINQGDANNVDGAHTAQKVISEESVVVAIIGGESEESVNGTSTSTLSNSITTIEHSTTEKQQETSNTQLNSNNPNTPSSTPPLKSSSLSNITSTANSTTTTTTGATNTISSLTATSATTSATTYETTSTAPTTATTTTATTTTTTTSTTTTTATASNALRSSTQNLQVHGIEEEEDDEPGMKSKKYKKKDRSHSRIVLRHKKNLIGETVYKGHQSWVLMLNIQTGIRNAVGRGHSRSTVSSPRPPLILTPSQNHVLEVTASPAEKIPSTVSKYPIDVLTPNSFENVADFYASPRVLGFPTSGSSTTIPHQTGPFKFKDYCPHAFRFLRHRFSIDTADYMVSLCNTQKNGENALRELPTPGKSGSLFFFSHDMRFIIKTIPKSEAKLLRALLPAYVEHIANDENTLLPKFFGLHRVKPHKGRQVRFLVMSNVFQTRKNIHERYDLKGSTLGRQATEEEKKKKTVTYKDLDFRERHMKIQIGPQKRSALLDQLDRDCKFLAKLNIMDYSLLIGIHNGDKGEGFSSEPPSPPATPSVSVNPEGPIHEYFHSIFQTNDGGMKGFDEHGLPNGKYYYMGIIDILMLYSIRKQVEHTYKTLRYGKAEEISSVSPHEYATRFYEFIAASIV
jgi:hypothetical protein